eukprot:UN13180
MLEQLNEKKKVNPEVWPPRAGRGHYVPKSRSDKLPKIYQTGEKVVMYKERYDDSTNSNTDFTYPSENHNEVIEKKREVFSENPDQNTGDPSFDDMLQSTISEKKSDSNLNELIKPVVSNNHFEQRTEKIIRIPEGFVEEINIPEHIRKKIPQNLP